MNCPECDSEMVKSQMLFGAEFDYCRTCRKELSETIQPVKVPKFWSKDSGLPLHDFLQGSSKPPPTWPDPKEDPAKQTPSFNHLQPQQPRPSPVAKDVDLWQQAQGSGVNNVYGDDELTIEDGGD